jgi:MscS family membrane protein
MNTQEILRQEFLGNTVANYLLFAGIMLFGYLFKKALSKLLTDLLFNLAKPYTGEVSKVDFKRLLVTPLEFLTFLVFLYIAFGRLHYPVEFIGLPEKGEIGLKGILQRLYSLFLIVLLTWVALRLVDFFGLIFRKRAENTMSKLDDQLVPFFQDFTKVIVVSISFFVVLGIVFHVNVTKLVAGLGVGGLALAFAAKESLENLLASFTIFLDQPFVVGDQVEVGEIAGIVEKIGFRSTRIRTMEKSYVTVPNKLMIDKPLDNLTLRTFRRVKFDVNLTYDTSSDQLKNITADMHEAIRQHPRTNEEVKIAFYSLAPHAKNLMVQYFIDTMDWNEYIDIKQEINYLIVDIVEKHKGQFAYPTTTLHLPGEAEGNPLKERLQEE